MRQLALSGPFTDRNDRFSHPFIPFTYWKPYPLLCTWSLKKVPLSGGASPCRPSLEGVAPFPAYTDCSATNCHALLSRNVLKVTLTPRCTDAFSYYNDILSSQVICTLRRPKVIIRPFKTYLAFAIFPYFLFQSHCLLITNQPEFNTHPQNKAKTQGENVNFTCNAVGNPAPTFPWTRDGSVVITTSRIVFNENNKTLTITNVIRGDNGEYICVATNNVNTVESNPSTLNVQCKDTFAWLFSMLGS